METFLQATKKNMIDDHNIKFKSMYIDMDLVMHRTSNSPRARRIQKSLDSHEDFEFSMSKMSIKDDTCEPAMEVASADKLFFRGQLLPLQQDPKLQSVQTLICPKEEACGDKGASFPKHYVNLLNFQFPSERGPLVRLEEPHKKCASEKGLLNMMSDNAEIFPMQCVSQAGYNPLKYRANEEGFSPECSLRDGIDLMRSCRLDGVFDLFKNDSRSSSFRSHQSSYWSSGEKDSRDSISSSRCSNGSYQDSCFQSGERKAPHISMLKANHLNTNANVENECDIGAINANAEPNQCRIRGKPPIPNANSRKWSWKGFFTGLRKASKLWVDDEKGDGGQISSKGDLGDMQKKSVFTFKELPGALGEPVSCRRSVGHDWEWQANTYQFVSNEGSSKKGRQCTRGLNLGIRDDLYEEQQIGTVYCLRSGGRQEASFNGSAGDCVQRDKGKVHGNAWNAKESWNRCVSKVKKGTRLSYNACKMQQKQLSAMQRNNNNAMLMNELEDKMDVYRVMKAKSLSSTPLTKSPVRRPEYSSNGNGNGGYGGIYSMQGGANTAISSSSSSSAMKNMGKKVGFASCPASMRSSPHHSGLLAVVNKATPDLHTAIQGAIAHCKQSQASNPP